MLSDDGGRAGGDVQEQRQECEDIERAVAHLALRSGAAQRLPRRVNAIGPAWETVSIRITASALTTVSGNRLHLEAPSAGRPKVAR
ncbi:MAG TPA: hypothetical protein VFB66_17675, partial [Tepidisphaeraceae bacterium]|nr:hypothetical protein [Tepidisphaeraceae bacterium]